MTSATRGPALAPPRGICPGHTASRLKFVVLGAGPEAVDKFDTGETECPAGAALVRAAIDWRRAGLARLVKLGDLRVALPIYLQDRPDVPVDETSVTAGLQWATEKVNETVSLLVPHYRTGGENPEAGQNGDLPLLEVFDYLVDELVERAASQDRVQRDKALIPIDMYRLVVEAASRAERQDVEIAARAQSKFIGRTEELAELTAWLASPMGSSPPVGILHGLGGVGKTAILRRLQELSDPRTRELITGDPTQLLVNVPPFDAVIAARGRTGSELLAAICGAAGLEPMTGETDGAYAMRLVDTLRRRHEPMIVAIDGLDEAIDSEQAMRILLELYRADGDLPLRIFVSTRELPPQARGVVRLFEVGAGTQQDLMDFARYRLVSEWGSASAELAEKTAHVIADFAQGSFLVGTIICAGIIRGSLPSEPATLARRLEESRLVRPEGPRDASIRDLLEQWLDSLGERKPDALVLLTALARGPSQGMTAEEWLAAASLLGGRPYSKADIDWLSQAAVVGRPREAGTYLLHDLVRAFVLDHQGYGTQPLLPETPENR